MTPCYVGSNERIILGKSKFGRIDSNAMDAVTA
jgi:hypothetical protein